MKRYLGIMVALVLGFLICFAPGLSLAQEEETEYSWGVVSSVSSNQITVKEYDYANEEEVGVTYLVDPNVTFTNIASLKNISVGDSIEIDYVVRGNKKVAKIIAVEESSYQEEQEKDTPLQTYYGEKSEYSAEEIEY